jgi:hypothetical protein
MFVENNEFIVLREISCVLLKIGTLGYTTAIM